MNILSVFITSNKVFLFLEYKSSSRTFEFSFYPSFQTSNDLEYLIRKFLESVKINVEELSIIPISTLYQLKIFGKPCRSLNEELTNFPDFTYIYFDNLNFYSDRNISATSFGLSRRSDNFISNRSNFSSTAITGDIEEIVYLSKSTNDFFIPKSRKVVVGGDYFSNLDIPNEYKMNLLSEILGSGFYEISIDNRNEFPNYLNLKTSTSFNLKVPAFEKFIYLITSEKDTQLMFNKESEKKYLEVPRNETYFLHFNDLDNIKLEFKGKEISRGTIELDSEYAGIFIDKRTRQNKKENLGIESFRKVLTSIDKNNDYSSL